MELSRQKKQSTIQEISYTPCPFCRGRGVRPSLEYTALTAYRKIETQAVKGLSSQIKVSLPYEVADYLLNQKRAEISHLESEYDMSIHISGSPDMAWDEWKIETTKRETPPAPEHAAHNGLKAEEIPEEEAEIEEAEVEEAEAPISTAKEEPKAESKEMPKKNGAAPPVPPEGHEPAKKTIPPAIASPQEEAGREDRRTGPPPTPSAVCAPRRRRRHKPPEAPPPAREPVRIKPPVRSRAEPGRASLTAHRRSPRARGGRRNGVSGSAEKTTKIRCSGSGRSSKP